MPVGVANKIWRAPHPVPESRWSRTSRRAYRPPGRARGSGHLPLRVWQLLSRVLPTACTFRQVDGRGMSSPRFARRPWTTQRAWLAAALARGHPWLSAPC